MNTQQPEAPQSARKQRIPVVLIVHDADAKPHEFGPIMVEIDDVTKKSPEFWHEQDRRAREYLLPDIHCDSLLGVLRMEGGR